MLDGKSYSGEDVFGLVMLAYCAHVGRTHAGAGEIWPAVWERLHEPIRSTLFRNQNYPILDLRAAIRNAARKFGMRHTFDSAEPQQAFMRTFQLQFGLSWNRETISEYQPPVIVAQLAAPGDPNYSSEFHRLWEALLKFRHRLIDERTLTGVAANNRWLPEGGVDQLLSWARPQQTKSERQQTQVFLRPRITAQRQLRLPLSSTLAERLTEDRYRLEVQNGTIRRSYDLVRQTNRFRLLLAGEAQTDVQLPLGDPLISVRLTVEGRDVYEETVDVRPMNGLFTIYSSGGVEQDEDAGLSQTASYTILHAADVQVRPEYTWVPVFGSSWRLTFASGPFPAHFGVFAGSDRLWPPETAAQGSSCVRWTAVLSAGDGVWGGTTELLVKRHPIDLEPVTVSIGGNEFPVLTKPSAGTVKYVSRVPVSPQLLHADAIALLRCWGDGKAHSLRCFLIPGKHSGHLVEKDGRWEALQMDRCNRAILNGRLKVDNDHNQALIVAGKRICGRIQDGIGRVDISRVIGLGEPLCSIHGITTAASNSVLTKGVFHSGELERIDVDGEIITLTLRRALEATVLHSVRAWRFDDALSVDCLLESTEGNVWRVQYPGGQLLAVGLFFAGESLGSRFVGDSALVRLAELSLQTTDWPAMAAQIKAFRLPMLCKELREVVDRRSHAEPGATLLAWLPAERQANDPLAEALIQEIFAPNVPSYEDAADILRRLSLLTGDPMTDVVRGWSVPTALMRAAPLFVASTAYWGLAQIYPVQVARDLAPFCNKLAGQITSKLPQVRADAALELGGVDLAVLDDLANEAVKLIAERATPSAALDVACRSAAFSSYAAVKLLRSWSTTLHG